VQIYVMISHNSDYDKIKLLESLLLSIFIYSLFISIILVHDIYL